MEKDKHWSKKIEHGTGTWQFRFTAWTARQCPHFIRTIIAAVIVFFFFLGASKERKISKDYLCRVAKLTGSPKPRIFAIYKHFLSFALYLLEKFGGWDGKIPLSQIKKQNDDINTLVEQLNQGQGAFLICSHLGNMEILRSLTTFSQTHSSRNFDVFPIVDFSGTAKFNDTLREANPELTAKIIDANHIGPETMVLISEKVSQGNLVAIAGDRTSAQTRHRMLPVSFLGEQAHFPQGAFALAEILGAPIYFVFAVRASDLNLKSPYEMFVYRAKTPIRGPRRERDQRLADLAAEFANHLQKHCMEHPLQWYNFYNFWQDSYE